MDSEGQGEAKDPVQILSARHSCRIILSDADKVKLSFMYSLALKHASIKPQSKAPNLLSIFGLTESLHVESKRNVKADGWFGE